MSLLLGRWTFDSSLLGSTVVTASERREGMTAVGPASVLREVDCEGWQMGWGGLAALAAVTDVCMRFNLLLN